MEKRARGSSFKDARRGGKCKRSKKPLGARKKRAAMSAITQAREIEGRPKLKTGFYDKVRRPSFGGRRGEKKENNE